MHELGDKCQPVMIQKPKNLAPPPPLQKACLNEFKEVAKSFNEEARGARSTRQSAQSMSSLVESALEEVSSELSLEKLGLDDK